MLTISGMLGSRALEGMGAIASVGFLGFVGGYFGILIARAFTRWRTPNPVDAGEHASAWLGLAAIVVTAVILLR